MQKYDYFCSVKKGRKQNSNKRNPTFTFQLIKIINHQSGLTLFHPYDKGPVACRNRTRIIWQTENTLLFYVQHHPT